MFANFLCWDIAQLCVSTSVNEQCFSLCPFVYLYTYLCAFIYDYEKKAPYKYEEWHIRVRSHYQSKKGRKWLFMQFKKSVISVCIRTLLSFSHMLPVCHS